ncbi:MAG: hypothetical protein WAQ98_17060 [Blastocatellia bacterium]
MKKFANLVLIAVFLFSNQLVFAGGKGKKIEFPRDVVVNGTEVKKGKYNVQFDEKTNEVMIWQGDKLIAKSNAKKNVHNASHKNIVTEILVVKQGEKSVLKRLSLAGEQEDILLDMKNLSVSPQ